MKKYGTGEMIKNFYGEADIYERLMMVLFGILVSTLDSMFKLYALKSSKILDYVMKVVNKYSEKLKQKVLLHLAQKLLLFLSLPL